MFSEFKEVHNLFVTRLFFRVNRKIAVFWLRYILLPKTMSKKFWTAISSEVFLTHEFSVWLKTTEKFFSVLWAMSKNSIFFLNFEKMPKYCFFRPKIAIFRLFSRKKLDSRIFCNTLRNRNFFSVSQSHTENSWVKFFNEKSQKYYFFRPKIAIFRLFLTFFTEKNF